MSRNRVLKIAVEEHVIFPGAGQYFLSDNDKASPDRVRRLEAIVDTLSEMADQRVNVMDQAGIECSLLSLVTPGVQVEPDGQKAVALARQFNDELAQAIGDSRRFAGLAHLAMQSPSDAAHELERCAEQHDFVGFMINGHTCGRYLDDPSFDVVWERAVALEMPLYLHPAYSARVPDVLSEPIELTGALWGWMAETGGHALRMMVNGVFDRHPGLQMVLGHMGEALPFLAWRLDRGVLKLGSARRPRQLPSEYLRSNIYATTSGVLSSPALKCTLETMGADRVLFAVDYPFEESDAASDWLASVDIDDATYRAVARENTLRLYPRLAARLSS